MATVVRLEAEQRSGTTGDGFLLRLYTSCRHMLFIFFSQNSHVETQVHWYFAESVSSPLRLEKVVHLAEFGAATSLPDTSCEIPPVSFSSQ